MSDVAIVLVSHGELAAALLAATEGLLGPQEHCHALGVQPGEALFGLEQRCRALLSRGPAVVLADLALGSPANVIFELLSADVALVTGMNLGMVVEALWARRASDNPLEIAGAAARAGREQIASYPASE